MPFKKAKTCLSSLKNVTEALHLIEVQMNHLKNLVAVFRCSGATLISLNLRILHGKITICKCYEKPTIKSMIKHSTWGVNLSKSGYPWRRARTVSENCIWKQFCLLVLSAWLHICIFKPMKNLLSFALFLGQYVTEYKNISESPYMHSASLWTLFQTRVPQKHKATKINI